MVFCIAQWEMHSTGGASLSADLGHAVLPTVGPEPMYLHAYTLLQCDLRTLTE